MKLGIQLSTLSINVHTELWRKLRQILRNLLNFSFFSGAIWGTIFLACVRINWIIFIGIWLIMAENCWEWWINKFDRKKESPRLVGRQKISAELLIFFYYLSKFMISGVCNLCKFKCASLIWMTTVHTREREKNSEKGKKLNRSAAGSISVDLLNAYNT